MNKWIFFILLPFWVNATMFWQTDLQKPFMFSIQIHPQEITLGDLLHVEVEYQYPSTYEINRETFIYQMTWSANPFDQQWVLLNSDISPLSLEENLEGEKLKLTFAPLVAGHLEFSFLNIIFATKEKLGTSLEITSPIFSFDVPLPPSLASLGFAPLIPLEPQFPLEMSLENRQQIIGNPHELEKIKNGIRHDLKKRSFPWMTLAILLAFSGIGWVLYLMRDRLPKRNTEIENASLSLKQKLDQKLQALQNLPFNPEEPSRYYVELSSILHDTIEGRSGLKTQTLTTTELSKKLKKQSSISSEQVDKTLSLLKEMDQVKFANKKPSQSEAQQHFEQMLQLINLLVKDEKFQKSNLV